MAPKFDLSVLILTLNEADNIQSLLPRVNEETAALGISTEVVVLDGGSTDGTGERARAHGARVVVQKQPGYAAAFSEGLRETQGRYVITLDADGSHPPQLIRNLWEARDVAEIVIASRYIPKGSFDSQPLRKFLSRLLNAFSSRFLNLPVKDMSSGFRLYRRVIFSAEEYTSEDFSILQEVLIKAHCAGYRIIEIPLQYLPRAHGKSHAKLGKFAWSYLRTFRRMWAVRNSAGAADYDHRAFDSLIPLQRYWQRKRCSLITSMLAPHTKGSGILDIGCGSSRIIQGHPNSVAFDFSPTKLRFLARTNRLRIRGSTFALPFGTNTFSQVIHSQLLEHVPFDAVIFRELNRVLKDGGTLVIGTPDYGRVQWRFIEYWYGKLLPNAYADEHITHYTRQILVDLLAQFGFRALDYRYICGGELIVKAVKTESIGNRQIEIKNPPRQFTPR